MNNFEWAQSLLIKSVNLPHEVEPHRQTCNGARLQQYRWETGTQCIDTPLHMQSKVVIIAIWRE